MRFSTIVSLMTFSLTLPLTGCSSSGRKIGELLKINRNNIVDVSADIEYWDKEEEKYVRKNVHFEQDVVDSFLNDLLSLKVYTTNNPCKCLAQPVILKLENEEMRISDYSIGNDRLHYSLMPKGSERPITELTNRYLGI